MPHTTQSGQLLFNIKSEIRRHAAQDSQSSSLPAIPFSVMVVAMADTWPGNIYAWRITIGGGGGWNDEKAVELL